MTSSRAPSLLCLLSSAIQFLNVVSDLGG